MLKTIWQVFLLALALPLVAQDSLKVLDEVAVLGFRIEQFSAGSKIQRLDSASLSLFGGLTVADYLQLKSPIYIKQYGGGGMQASISFRGTGANHTAVLWNGININSMLLGQSDFGLLQVANFENIALQYGSAASLVGSDAIGGTLHLDNPIVWKNKKEHHFLSELGSFGKLLFSYQLAKSTEKWYFKTHFLSQQAQNDFPFRNTRKIGQGIEKQQNASYKQASFQQDMYYKLPKNQFLALRFWTQKNFRNVQPTMTDLENKDSQTDAFFRTILEWQANKTWGEWNLKTAFLYDYFKFSNFEALHTYQQLSSFNFQNSFQKFHWRIGGQINRIFTENSNYEGNKEEYRNDWYVLGEYFFSKNVKIHLNFRQSFVSHFQTTPAPSWGLEWKFLDKKKHQLFSKMLLAKGFKVPTLNDRFWQQGGNPDLLPEKSWSFEKSFVYELQTKKSVFRSELSFFGLYVQNWILWQPTGTFWSAQNIAEVVSKGIEFSADGQFKTKAFELKTGLTYAFTLSENQVKKSDYDRSFGKQLPYTPIHKANLYYLMNYKGYFWQQNFSFTGRRFTTSDNENFLDSFFLSDWTIGKQLQVSKHTFDMSFQIANLFNVSYQNYENRAMPMRNFRLILRYRLN